MLTRRNPIRGFLLGVVPDPGVPDVVIEFQFNPTQLSDKQAPNYATLNAPGRLLPLRQYSQGGDRAISFTVRVDGMFAGPADDQIPISRDDAGSITPELNKYRALVWPRTSNWQQAGGSFAGLYPETTKFAAPPDCIFGFGERTVDCVITEISITELLFTADLAPLRADVAVSLVERMPYEDAAGVAPMQGAN